MKIQSYVLGRALKSLRLPELTLQHIELAGALSEVDGTGFPEELFQLSAPMVARGLHNYAVLQMRRDWVFPYWVRQQLDHEGPGFVPRSQNPLLLNVTQRNWTALGSPTGKHEAIIDPRGLATPLPREWSVDTWIAVDGKTFFPSNARDARQDIASGIPRLTTSFDFDGLGVELEHFVDSTNQLLDILFGCATVTNRLDRTLTACVGIAVRPFNPEGIAPVQRIEHVSPRMVSVNRTVGVVFAADPDGFYSSTGSAGDGSALFAAACGARRNGKAPALESSARCPQGLASGFALYRFELPPAAAQRVHWSVALGAEAELRRKKTKTSWRVSYAKRKSRHEERWKEEVSRGARFLFSDEHCQKIFDASLLALLELQEGEFISPGPFLYHHFWYRDAGPMLRALDIAGHPNRVRQVLDAFPRRMTPEGFFRGPAGEWDSNGIVLWSIYHHFLLTRSESWLRKHLDILEKGARWIMRMRRNSHNGKAVTHGIMPASLSAEHLGTVDQYFWDSFWSLAGVKALCAALAALGMEDSITPYSREVHEFERVLKEVLESIKTREGEELIPATPTRGFDETAIGSVCAVYPLELFGRSFAPAERTLRKIAERFVETRGFFHPVIHSGYNPYLTLQVAHSFLYLGEGEDAWRIAGTILSNMKPPYSLPEAIHPKTGGGAMGDGHHGWAAAEVILFLRDCVVREVDDELRLFEFAIPQLVSRGKDCSFKNLPTEFGTISASLRFESAERATLEFEASFFEGHRPRTVSFHLPFEAKRIVSVSPNQVEEVRAVDGGTVLRCSSGIGTVFFEL